MMRFLLKRLSMLLSRLPLKTVTRIGRALGWVYGHVVRYHRGDALRALQRSFPEKSPSEVRAIADRMYAHLGINIVETVRLPYLSNDSLRAQMVIVQGEEIVKKALERGKGAIILTGHVGNWEMMVSVTPLWGYSLTVIAKELKGATVNDFWNTVRSRFGVNVLPPKNAFRPCLKTLRSNGLVGFILDQNMTRKEGVFVDFFGLPASTSPGLAYMAARSGAPVLPAFTLRREDGRHDIRVMVPIEPPTDHHPDTIRRFTQQYTKIIEDVVRQHPEQWIWCHRRWRTQPRAQQQGPA